MQPQSTEINLKACEAINLMDQTVKHVLLPMKILYTPYFWYKKLYTLRNRSRRKEDI